HKSVRDGDPDGALYWLARMLEAGEDPLFLARRLVRMAVEDIGLADPQALSLALAARDAYHFLGTPEGELALADAAGYLACAANDRRVSMTDYPDRSARAPRKLRIGVVFGGRSGEHEVSLASAASVLGAIDGTRYEVVPMGITRDGQWLVGSDPLRALADTAGVRLALPPHAARSRSEPGTALARLPAASGLPAGAAARLDVVFPVLHGPYGEDGTLQGLLELADVAYVGAGVLASAVGMDKATMKAVFSAHGLPLVEYTVVLRSEWRERPEVVGRRVREVTGFPCFVKPSNLGSSVGISRVKDAAALPAALDEAARYDRKIVVERAVQRPREVEVSVLGNDAPDASLPGEITYEADWYDYATKYAEGQARITVPARIGPT